MPGSVTEVDVENKRKRLPDREVPIKRSRSEDKAVDHVQAQILLLENEIFESKKSYNNISKLIQILLNVGASDNAIFAAISLCRVFTRLMASGKLKKRKDSSDKELVVVRWLKERYAEYKKSIVAWLSDTNLAATMLTLCMRLLKTEGQYLWTGQDYNFPVAFLNEIVRVLVRPDGDPEIRKEFSRTYVEECDDIRFYTYKAISHIFGEGDEHSHQPKSLGNALEILIAIDTVPDSNDELEDFWVPAPNKKTHALYSLTQHKNRAQEAWLCIMSSDIDRKQRKALLGQLTNSIAPWFAKPELLMDFLTDSYNSGGSMSLLALSGIFYLIQERNLDYPMFYPKLYSLLDENILHSKHRSRFIRLLDTFLASTHLPALLVASFIKRLSRLCLNAPPTGIVAIIPWVYNLLKRHPACTFMIHRETRGEAAKARLENEGLVDPFNMYEKDPMKTQGIESSLWELVMLQSHYHPNVATLAKIISEQFTKNAYSLEDFLDHSYGSMLEAELSRGVKVPVVEYHIPKKILSKYDKGAGEDSLLVKLWSFT